MTKTKTKRTDGLIHFLLGFNWTNRSLLSAKEKMMPTIQSITSKQETRIVDLAADATRDSTRTVLEQVPLDSETAQTKIIAQGGEFQRMIKPEIQKIVKSALSRLSGYKHQAADDIERFYFEVLGIKLYLSGVLFPEKQGFPAYMAVMPGLNEDVVMTKICAHFKVKPYTWKTSIAEHIDRKSAQKRTEGLYVFAHGGTDEHDLVHLGKSYNDATDAKMIFVNPLEYLLMTAFHKWKHDTWMDMKGWTRTSSVWSDGPLVNGYFDSDTRGLYMDYDHPDYRNAIAGPRELVWG